MCSYALQYLAMRMKMKTMMTMTRRMVAPVHEKKLKMQMKTAEYT